MNYKVVNIFTEEEKTFVKLGDVFLHLELEIKRLNDEFEVDIWNIDDFAVYEFHAPTWEWRQVY